MRPTNRTTWILLLSFLGLVGLENPGCSNEAENAARNGKDPNLKGECTPAADDGNPCTLEGCEGQANAHVVTAGLACGLNNDLGCTATVACGGRTTAGPTSLSPTRALWAGRRSKGACRRAVCRGLATSTRFVARRLHPMGKPCKRKFPRIARSSFATGRAAKKPSTTIPTYRSTIATSPRVPGAWKSKIPPPKERPAIQAVAIRATAKAIASNAIPTPIAHPWARYAMPNRICVFPARTMCKTATNRIPIAEAIGARLASKA